ncbi:MAG: tripartite tricarboxylate transporter TctB family protein [Clostridiales bacterium]|nr:tripartite tricarboxylate transporter TctB family protein [Clostridiales bacterium]
MIKNKKDFGLGVAAVLIAAIITYMSMQLKVSAYLGDPGPRMFPLIGAAIIFICGVALIVRQDQNPGVFLTPKQWKSAFIMFAVYAIATLLFYLVGFAVALPIIFFCLTFMMSKLSLKDLSLKKRIIKAAIYAILAGAGVYVAYVVALGASLPKGVLFRLI